MSFINSKYKELSLTHGVEQFTPLTLKIDNKTFLDFQFCINFCLNSNATCSYGLKQFKLAKKKKTSNMSF